VDKVENHFLGSGWSFPVRFLAGNHQLVTTKYEDNINESIRIIFETKMGERCMEPFFGSGLQQFFFRTMDETLRGEIRNTLEIALLNNEPRISVESIEIEFADVQQGLINILVTYIFNNTNTRQNYVFPFHLNEGTNL